MNFSAMCLPLMFCIASMGSHAQVPAAATALQRVHASKSADLARSPLQRPVLLDSRETADGLQGDVYAVIDQPVEALHAAFNTPAHWCDVLLLHVNNRRCRAGRADDQPQITLGIVRRYDKPAIEAFDLTFGFRVAQVSPEHLEVKLHAASGPFGTSNYRILLEAVRLDAGRSFVHFSYSYDQNMMVAMAVQAYLATFGASKVGFTEVGKLADGKPAYIAGTRGLVERNAMRYFLALEAFLGSPDDEARRSAWFNATERYPRQLREVERETYLGLKRADAASAAPRATPP